MTSDCGAIGPKSQWWAAATAGWELWRVWGLAVARAQRLAKRYREHAAASPPRSIEVGIMNRLTHAFHRAVTRS